VQYGKGKYMSILFFIAFMALLIIIAPERFWYIFVLILGVAVHMGYQLSMFGLLIWMGLAKVARDIFYAGREC
jgi:hypothetical protein